MVVVTDVDGKVLYYFYEFKNNDESLLLKK